MNATRLPAALTAALVGGLLFAPAADAISTRKVQREVKKTLTKRDYTKSMRFVPDCYRTGPSKWSCTVYVGVNVGGFEDAQETRHCTARVRAGKVYVSRLR